MAQIPCIGLYKPCLNLPFGDRAMYFDHGVPENGSVPRAGIKQPNTITSDNSPSKKKLVIVRSRKLEWNLKINPF